MQTGQLNEDFPAEYYMEFKKLLHTVAKSPKVIQKMPSDWKGLTAFWPLKGKRFEKGKGLMVIGQAVNGWDDHPKNPGYGWSPSDIPSISDSIIKSLKRYPMSWAAMQFGNKQIKKNKNDIKKYYDRNPFNISDVYNTRWKSPFWRVIHKVIEAIYNKGIDDLWSDHICWSNLYKISPYKKGNPPDWLCENQIESCVELLRIEIETWQPNRVLVLTGENWYAPPNKKFSFHERLPKEIRPIISWRSEDFVQGVGYGQQKEQRWVITRHPRYKKSNETEGKFAEQILEAFENC